MKSFFFFFLFITLSYSQTLTGNQLLDKAISYHDPNNNWSTFNSKLNITMQVPNKSNRDSEIHINLPKGRFYLKAIQDKLTTEYTLEKEKCTIKLNGKSDLDEKTLNTNNLSCDRGTLYKNYYTYLYGLPMKLKDSGANINQKIERKTFKGKEYFVLEVNYDKAIGTDLWYFYFNTKTYAMEIYQFFKTDDKGKQKKETGEYILLTSEEVINSIKMPKTRAWYYNKDDQYLGTDILKQ